MKADMFTNSRQEQNKPIAAPVRSVWPSLPPLPERRQEAQEKAVELIRIKMWYGDLKTKLGY